MLTQAQAQQEFDSLVEQLKNDTVHLDRVIRRRIINLAAHNIKLKYGIEIDTTSPDRRKIVAS
jgi:hypothetical protein